MCCCCVDSELVAADVEVVMGKASKERRRIERLARFQPQEFSSFADLASFAKDKATAGADAFRDTVKDRLSSTGFGSSARSTVLPVSAMTSRIKEAQTMSTSRIQSFVSTVFKGKGATAMGGNGMKKRWPILGAMVVALTGALGYYGYNALQGSDRSTTSAPTYQYQAERPVQTAPSHTNSNSGSSFFNSAKVAEVLSLRKANPNIKRTSHGKSGGHSAKLHKKGKHGKKHGRHGSRHAMKKKKGKGNIHQATHKKHGHKKGGHLAKKSKKKKHHVAHH